MNNHIYEYNGKPLTEYCREEGISYSSAYRKILDGLTIEEAVEHAHKARNNYSHRKSRMDGISVIEFFETNYKRPITAYLRYSKLKSEGYSKEEILQKLEKFKEK